MNGIGTKILGESPNEIWSRSGQSLVIIGGMSAVGFRGFGIEVMTVGWELPLALIVLGFVAMYFGQRLRKILAMAEQSHEIEKRRASRPKPDPNRGDREFLAWFTQTFPNGVTRAELSRSPFPYDAERSHDDLVSSSTVRRADWWAMRGEIKLIGDHYEVRS